MKERCRSEVDTVVSNFQRKIYDTLRLVPKGRVITYKLLAEAVGCKSPQAVGQALRHNPYAPEVPCHRVIKSDLSVGGFHGHTFGAEIQRKVELLKSEGVLFSKDGKIEHCMLFVPKLLI